MKKFMILASVVAIVVAALALPALAQDLSPFGGDQDQQRNLDERFDNWQDIAEKREYTEQETFDFYLDRLSNFYGFDGFDNNRWNDDDDQDHRWDNDRDWWNDDRDNDNDDEVV